MEDAADADFLCGSCDRVIHFPHAHQLERLHPIAQVVEHEDEVVVMLERLAFHAGDRFQILRIFLILKQLANLVLHESRRR